MRVSDAQRSIKTTAERLVILLLQVLASLLQRGKKLVGIRRTEIHDVGSFFQHGKTSRQLVSAQVKQFNSRKWHAKVVICAHNAFVAYLNAEVQRQTRTKHMRVKMQVHFVLALAVKQHVGMLNVDTANFLAVETQQPLRTDSTRHAVDKCFHAQIRLLVRLQFGHGKLGVKPIVLVLFKQIVWVGKILPIGARSRQCVSTIGVTRGILHVKVNPCNLLQSIKFATNCGKFFLDVRCNHVKNSDTKLS